ncbi:MAG: hypothetical protein ACTHK8_10790 [Ginsengibacter sp.]
MEVHHHPHVEKKGVKEYFFEFLMIFLAVTLGFFAESFREYLNNRSKENEYMASLVEDLKSDTAFLNLSIHTLIPYHLKWMDSTRSLLQMPEHNGKDRMVYQALIIGTAWTYDFHFTQRTLSQLHSEGFSLIRKEEAVDAITQLESNYELFSPVIDVIQKMQNDIDISSYGFLNGTDDYNAGKIAFEDPLFTRLKLSDVPATAIVIWQNKNAILLYSDKLNKYSFYLRTGVLDDYEIFTKEITETIKTIQKAYKLQ